MDLGSRSPPHSQHPKCNTTKKNRTPKCGHNWNYKGKHHRAPCPVCKYRKNETIYVKTGLPFYKKTSPLTSPSISDDIMQGNYFSS